MSTGIISFALRVIVSVVVTVATQVGMAIAALRPADTTSEPAAEIVTKPTPVEEKAPEGLAPNAESQSPEEPQPQ